MPIDVFPEWPDFAALSKHGESASLTDDLGRSQLNVSVIVPHWTERAIVANDRHTRQNAGLRLLCPLMSDGRSPFTLLAVYNLQAALLRDAEPVKIKITPPLHSKGKVREGEFRIADTGRGGLAVQRLNRDWLALTVNDENLREEKSPPSVTVFFNRHRRPNTYSALVALAQGIRRDNNHYPLS